MPPDVLHPDATAESADWTKGTWDLPVSLPAELDWWLAEMEISPASFKSLPVFRRNVSRMPWLAEWAAQTPGEGDGQGFAERIWIEPFTYDGKHVKGHWRTSTKKRRYPSSLNVEDDDLDQVRAYVKDFDLIPPKTLHSLRSRQVKWFIGSKPLPELDAMQHLRGQHPRGWSAGSTWEECAGCYNSWSRHAVITAHGARRDGSEAIVLHETGHAIFHHILRPRQKRELADHHRRLYSKLDAYHQQGGPGGENGMNEMFAETFAKRLKRGRAQAIRYTDIEFVNWLERIAGIEYQETVGEADDRRWREEHRLAAAEEEPLVAVTAISEDGFTIGDAWLPASVAAGFGDPGEWTPPDPEEPGPAFAEWDPELHPRHQGGSSRGGQFRTKHGVGALVQFLEQTLKMMQAHHGDEWRQERAYFNDSDLILKHGRPFQGQNLPDGYPEMPAKECYRNAAEIVLQHPDLTYVEGVAMPADMPMPFPHAWAVDKDGNVIDPTWAAFHDLHKTYYFGIPFRRDWLFARLLQQGYYSVLDWRNRDLYQDPLPADAIAEVGGSTHYAEPTLEP